MSPEQLERKERKKAYNREYMRERARRGLRSKERSSRKFCECGNVAEVACGGIMICRRCHQLDNERKYDR